MRLNTRQRHARDIEKLRQQILKTRRIMAKTWHRVDNDPRLRELQERILVRRSKLEEAAEMQCYKHRRTLVVLEDKLKTALAAHDTLVSAKLVAWLNEMRGRSPARKGWTLAWFTDDEKFALLRRPANRIRINATTVHGYGIRHDLYDLRAKPKHVYEFVGRMTRANWEVAYRYIDKVRNLPKAAAGAMYRPNSPGKSGGCQCPPSSGQAAPNPG